VYLGGGFELAHLPHESVALFTGRKPLRFAFRLFPSLMPFVCRVCY